MAASYPQAMGLSNASTAIVFARLDPILKNLLEGLTSLKALLSALSATNPHSDKLETTFVRLVKSIATDLESLSKTMVLEEERSFQKQQRIQHAKALCLLTKYIALPLNAVFRLPLRKIFALPQGDSDGETRAPKTDPRLAIRRSYVFEMYHLAAIAMQRFIQETTIEMGTKHNKNLLPASTWVDHLVALVHSMPTYSEITKTNAATKTMSASLDDGSNAYCSILEATKSLLACFASTTSEKSANLLLKDAWHGTLAMRLVDCLTAFLLCSPSEVFSPTVHQKALETLLAMLRVTNPEPIKVGGSRLISESESFWRSVFPGIFTALYQRITTNVTSKSKKPSSSDLMIRIQKLSLQSLISLLRMTLSTSADKKEKRTNACRSPSKDKDLDSNEDLLAKLNSMVITANNNTESNKISGRETEDEGESIQSNQCKEEKETNRTLKEEQIFYEQVRKRVQNPLIFLLRQLSLSSNDDIRRNIVVLCKIILFETRDCWEEEMVATSTTPLSVQSSSENPMQKIPLELCIGFLQDPDSLVRVSAREIIDSYNGIRNANSLYLPSTWMVPRVIELVQKLSTLVRRGTTDTTNIESGTGNISTTATDLRTDLNLLSGYITCLNASANDVGKTSGKESRALNRSICNSIVSSKHLRRGLIQLFDVDLESLNNKNKSMVTLMFDHNSKSPIKLRHLDHPDLTVLKGGSILRSLGRLLGPKHGAIFVDEVLSDFIEASFQMPKPNTNSSSNDLFAGWLHEWIGSLVVAREVLSGSFSSAATAAATAFVGSTDEKEKRKRRILLSLASSILPLIVGCSLWNLSTENQITTTRNVATNNNDTTLSQQTLQRNQIVVILLMELVGVFSQLLRGDLKEVLVTILYPIVEKTTQRGSKTNCDVIQQTGISTLKIISLSCDLKSAEDLIHAEQNRLISAMIGRLRLPGGTRIPHTVNNAQEILSVTKTSIWMLEMINRRIEKSSRSMDKEEVEKDSAVMDLITLLDYRLDHLFLQKVLVDADVETICSLHKAFFNYFLHLFRVEREVTYSYRMKNLEKEPKQPWVDLLSQFRKVPVDSQEVVGGDEAEESKVNLLNFTKSDIELFAKLIARDCYLLSYQKLKSRISSCDALTMAFKFLAFVGSEHYDPTDDRNVIRNTILRQVADSWPSIRARLKSLSDIILSSYSSKSSSIILVLNQNNSRGNQKPEDIGTQRIFLSKLFQLIATMCECSGDFFVDRFRNDVWPCMARHLEYMLQELQRQREAHSSSTMISSEEKLITTMTESNALSLGLSNRTKLSFKMSETQGQLILSILRCLNRILDQEECGKALEKVLGSIGSTLLPLLDVENQTKIQELSMSCIRSIIKIDSDVLRRTLMELSGTKIPQCPLKFNRAFGVERGYRNFSLPLSVEEKDTIMGNRCHDLLAFADALPEQAIS